MTADTASLQERLWEAVAEVRDQHPRVFNDAPTDDVIAAIFPIIAAEVRAAKAEALRDAADSVRDNAASPYCLPCHRDDADLLHTIATEHETGGRA